MESVVNYLEDVEKKLKNEMSELFDKLKDHRDTISLEGIKDMYVSNPVEGVLYDPCVRIPAGFGSAYYCSNFILPKGEYVIFTFTSMRSHMSGQYGDTHKCIVLTNYGRCFITKQITGVRGQYSYYSYINDNQIHRYSQGNSFDITPILKLDPLPNKIPTRFINAFILGFKIGNINIDSLHQEVFGNVNECVLKTISDTTNALQELNKEFYLFAGKWQPHMTERATLDVDTMRQTIIENKACIQDLSEKNKTLEEQNKRLLAEVKELKEQKTALEKEKAKLLPLEMYKKSVLDFIEKHYNDDDDPFHPDDTVETEGISVQSICAITKSFSNWHSNKVFMDSGTYDDLMESKEELNEYRIYKKVKAEMVSSGMDTSNVASNVSRINNNVNKLKK